MLQDQIPPEVCIVITDMILCNEKEKALALYIKKCQYGVKYIDDITENLINAIEMCVKHAASLYGYDPKLYQ